MVLCGGASRRMGRDKALLEVDGVAMAVRVADALRAAGATDVLAVGGDPVALGTLGLDVRPDDDPGEGPLPATLTALRNATTDLAVVLPCDLRHPDPAAIAHLLDALATAPMAAGAVAVVADEPQWASMAWRVGPAVAGLAAARAAGARSLRRAAPSLPLVEVHELPPEAFADADTPADLPEP